MNRERGKSLAILGFFLTLNLGAILAFRRLEHILEIWGNCSGLRRPFYTLLLVASSILPLITWGICRRRPRTLFAACMMTFLYLLVLFLFYIASPFEML